MWRIYIFKTKILIVLNLKEKLARGVQRDISSTKKTNARHLMFIARPSTYKTENVNPVILAMICGEENVSKTLIL